MFWKGRLEIRISVKCIHGERKRLKLKTKNRLELRPGLRFGLEFGMLKLLFNLLVGPVHKSQERVPQSH